MRRRLQSVAIPSGFLSIQPSVGARHYEKEWVFIIFGCGMPVTDARLSVIFTRIYSLQVAVLMETIGERPEGHRGPPKSPAISLTIEEVSAEWGLRIGMKKRPEPPDDQRFLTKTFKGNVNYVAGGNGWIISLNCLESTSSYCYSFVLRRSIWSGGDAINAYLFIKIGWNPHKFPGRNNFFHILSHWNKNENCYVEYTRATLFCETGISSPEINQIIIIYQWKT